MGKLATNPTFLDRHLWRIDSKPPAMLNTTVTPFNHTSSKFYWEKAYLDFCNHRDRLDKIAAMGQATMNKAYFGFNLFGMAAPAVKPLASVIPIAAITWNLIDVSGVLALAARDQSKGDSWAAKTHVFSSLQLTMGTVLFALLTYSKELHAGALSQTLAGQIGAAGVSALAVGASGFTFAAAMAFAWGLEHREVKLHQARIAYLDEKIRQIECKPNFQLPKEYNKDGTIEEKIAAITPDTETHTDLLELLQFRQHQQEQLEVHLYACTGWKLSTAFMLAAAVIAVTIVSAGVSSSSWAIAMTIAASAGALLYSATFRNITGIDKSGQNTGPTSLESNSPPTSDNKNYQRWDDIMGVSNGH